MRSAHYPAPSWMRHTDQCCVDYRHESVCQCWCNLHSAARAAVVRCEWLHSTDAHVQPYAADVGRGRMAGTMGSRTVGAMDRCTSYDPSAQSASALQSTRASLDPPAASPVRA